MSMRRQVVLGAAAAVLAAGAGGAYWLVRGRSEPPPSPEAAALFALQLSDLAGAPAGLEQWRGKLLVVNFWATWCTPCREEMPEFVLAQSRYASKGLQFVGIGIDDAAKLQQFAASIGVNYPILVGGYPALQVSKSLGNKVMALPFTVVVGRRGGIAHTQLGPLKGEQLQAVIEKHL